MSKIIKCQGCGALMQTEKEETVGYALELTHEYCQACYRLLHYGVADNHFHPEDLPSLNSDSLIVMVSSVLHLDLLFSYPVYRYQSNAKYVYLINQIDLLPNSTNLDLMLKNLLIRAKKLRIPFVDIILMSAKNKIDIENFKGYLQSCKNRDIYLLGVQNSGKTTLFNALSSQSKALAFKKAGLTQEALSATFDKQTIWDMPGLYQEGYLHHILPYETYKSLIPSKVISPKIYQLKSEQTLFIEGLIAVTVMSDSTAVFYGSNSVKIHKTNSKKVKGLIEDKEQQFKIFAEKYEEKSYRIPIGKQQITFADMGFMHLKGPTNIKVLYPKGMHISVTEAIFQ